MHDPQILGIRVRLPVGRRKKRAWTKEAPVLVDEETGKPQYETVWWDIADIWHVDPEKKGSDDSCGFTIPHLTKKQREILKSWAWHEGRNPYFLRMQAKHWTYVPEPEREPRPDDDLPVEDDRPELVAAQARIEDHGNGTMDEAEALYRGLLLHVCRLLKIKMTYEEAAKRAALKMHAPDCVHPADMFCYAPGWHTNSTRDRAEGREERFTGILIGMARWLLAERRPWWKHPRWHVWHWKINIHGIQNFKRWAFSRCCKCGKGFKWGYCVTSNSWHGTGPRWFRGEKDVFHSNCDRPTTQNIGIDTASTTKT